MWVVSKCTTSGDLEESLHARIQRIQDRVRDLNRQIIYQAKVIQDHATQGLSYLDAGDEQMARSEAQLQLQATESRQVYIDVFTKLRMLLSEIERTQNLSICVESLTGASGVIKDISLNVTNVDEMLVRLDQQVEGARDVSKALQKPLKTQTLRDVFTSAKVDFELPSVPHRDPVAIRPGVMEMEL